MAVIKDDQGKAFDRKNRRVMGIHKKADGELERLTYVRAGERTEIAGDIVISSMPLKDLVEAMDDVPENELRIERGLPYRDYMTVGVLVRNRTDIRTINSIIPDCWIYIQERKVRMGRIQIYNNWSPYMVANLEYTVWLGLEYFV